MPVHRGENGRLLAEPYLVSFLTSPAPDAGQVLRRDPGAGERIRRALTERAFAERFGSGADPAAFGSGADRAAFGSGAAAGDTAPAAVSDR
ncbi:uncharacterized protein (TIGR02452 family) [Nonomuraea thailandensis]|uniref:Uncharacterized protein (TIGR02452 family) n=1 Tax=Nonomuraea thailandensis TaxID=1188745 RepID=A0A9X2GHX4_9ACTN|nr:hypothetical protein [Nonomuraea thailandensis]MCP2355696.1 uncharacterized protein (TIGR02452 family) [Nonomuraea thailandensis]